MLMLVLHSTILYSLPCLLGTLSLLYGRMLLLMVCFGHSVG